MSAGDKPRVFLGFHDIALYQSKLKEGLEKFGCRVTRIAWRDDLKFGDDDSRRAWPFRLLRLARRWSEEAWGRVDRTPKTALFRLAAHVSAARMAGALKKILQWASLAWTVARHDVIVLSYNGSFVEWDDHTMCPVNRRCCDLRFIKACGRKLVFTFHGSDSRPPYLDGYVMRNTKRLQPSGLAALTLSRRRLVREIERYADALVSVPAQTCFHTRPVILHEYLGRPFSEDAVADEALPGNAKPVVLHAPSNVHAKGTEVLRAAVERLRMRGVDFEYTEVIRRPHDELVDAFRRADVVVDQAYSDRFVTGIATEAMYFGKPVVIGGYYADYSRTDYAGKVPPPPVIFCRPEDIETELERLLRDTERRAALGRAGREYVAECFDPLAVARRWLALMKGELPESAFYDPRRLTYPFGCGLSREELRESVRSLLAAGGKEALCLSDKPALETAVLKLAE